MMKFSDNDVAELADLFTFDTEDVRGAESVVEACPGATSKGQDVPSQRYHPNAPAVPVPMSSPGPDMSCRSEDTNRRIYPQSYKQSTVDEVANTSSLAPALSNTRMPHSSVGNQPAYAAGCHQAPSMEPPDSWENVQEHFQRQQHYRQAALQLLSGSDISTSSREQQHVSPHYQLHKTAAANTVRQTQGINNSVLQRSAGNLAFLQDTHATRSPVTVQHKMPSVSNLHRNQQDLHSPTWWYRPIAPKPSPVFLQQQQASVRREVHATTRSHPNLDPQLQKTFTPVSNLQGPTNTCRRLTGQVPQAVANLSSLQNNPLSNMSSTYIAQRSPNTVHVSNQMRQPNSVAYPQGNQSWCNTGLWHNKQMAQRHYSTSAAWTIGDMQQISHATSVVQQQGTCGQIAPPPQKLLSQIPMHSQRHSPQLQSTDISSETQILKKIASSLEGQRKKRQQINMQKCPLLLKKSTVSSASKTCNIAPQTTKDIAYTEEPPSVSISHALQIAQRQSLPPTQCIDHLVQTEIFLSKHDLGTSEKNQPEMCSEERLSGSKGDGLVTERVSPTHTHEVSHENLCEQEEECLPIDLSAKNKLPVSTMPANSHNTSAENTSEQIVESSKKDCPDEAMYSGKATVEEVMWTKSAALAFFFNKSAPVSKDSSSCRVGQEVRPAAVATQVSSEDDYYVAKEDVPLKKSKLVLTIRKEKSKGYQAFNSWQGENEISSSLTTELYSLGSGREESQSPSSEKDFGKEMPLLDRLSPPLPQPRNFPKPTGQMEIQVDTSELSGGSIFQTSFPTTEDKENACGTTEDKLSGIVKSWHKNLGLESPPVEEIARIKSYLNRSTAALKRSDYWNKEHLKADGKKKRQDSGPEEDNYDPSSNKGPSADVVSQEKDMKSPSNKSSSETSDTSTDEEMDALTIDMESQESNDMSPSNDQESSDRVTRKDHLTQEDLIHLHKWFKSCNYPGKAKESQIEEVAKECNIKLELALEWVCRQSHLVNTKAQKITDKYSQKLLEWVTHHENNLYPSDQEIEEIVGQTDIPIRQIRLWFARQRMKLNKKVWIESRR